MISFTPYDSFVRHDFSFKISGAQRNENVQDVNGFDVDTSGKFVVSSEQRAFLDQIDEKQKNGGSPLVKLDLTSESFAALFGIDPELEASERGALANSMLRDRLKSDIVTDIDFEALDPDVAVHELDAESGFAYVSGAMEVTFGRALEPDDISQVSSINVGWGYEPDLQRTLNDPGYKLGRDREQLNEFFELMDVEKSLKQQFGDDIKLAYDHRGDNLVMVRPGQAGYDDVKTMDEVWKEEASYLGRFGSPAQFADIFAKFDRNQFGY